MIRERPLHFQVVETMGVPPAPLTIGIPSVDSEGLRHAHGMCKAGAVMMKVYYYYLLERVSGFSPRVEMFFFARVLLRDLAQKGVPETATT